MTGSVYNNTKYKKNTGQDKQIHFQTEVKTLYIIIIRHIAIVIKSRKNIVKEQQEKQTATEKVHKWLQAC